MNDESAVATPAVPFFQLNNLTLLSLGDYDAACSSDVSGWLAGTPELGIQAGAAAFADCVLMYAATRCAMPGLMPVTVNMRLDFWRHPPALGTRMGARAAIVEPAESELLLVRGELQGPDGIVASATARSMLVPGAAPTAKTQEALGAHSSPAKPWAHPSSALDPVLALPVSRQIGLEAIRVGDDVVELAAVPDPTLDRTRGVVHGGAVPVIGQLGCAAVLQLAMPGVHARRLDTTVEYLRPTLVNQPVRIRASITHQSRRLATTHAEIVSASGKPSARVSETVALHPRG